MWGCEADGTSSGISQSQVSLLQAVMKYRVLTLECHRALHLFYLHRIPFLVFPLQYPTIFGNLYNPQRSALRDVLCVKKPTDFTAVGFKYFPEHYLQGYVSYVLPYKYVTVFYTRTN